MTVDVKNIAVRSASVVMKLDRMGSFHQSRLSFTRSLLRLLKNEKWEFSCPVWQMNNEGFGTAVYQAKGPRRTYSLIAFSNKIPDDARSDRVIANVWDATFCIFDGEPTKEDLKRLENNVPKQEEGRISEKELSLSRANRSVRLWNHVVEALSAGLQPSIEMIQNVGYLMRTTAVYGSGKFGAADRNSLSSRKAMVNPFYVEMLSVYLTRSFTLDLVEHIAEKKGGKKAVKLDSDIRRRLGVGNSTGLGMAPFLIHHPSLVHSWVKAREEALARVRSVDTCTKRQCDLFFNVLLRAENDVQNWRTPSEIQTKKIRTLLKDIGEIKKHFKSLSKLSCDNLWDKLYLWAEDNLSLEAQELLVSLIIEPYGSIVDDLANNMYSDEYSVHSIDGSLTVEEMQKTINDKYSWALDVNYDDPNNSYYYWYISEEKLEPRLGKRPVDINKIYEQPIGIGKAVYDFAQDLKAYKHDVTIADFLLYHPEHRHIVRRIQLVAKYKFAEIQDNLLAKELFPVDLLRFKLSFFGATHFDPKSDRWVRVCLYQNAPFPEDLIKTDSNTWIYPELTK